MQLIDAYVDLNPDKNKDYIVRSIKTNDIVGYWRAANILNPDRYWQYWKLYYGMPSYELNDPEFQCMLEKEEERQRLVKTYGNAKASILLNL